MGGAAMPEIPERNKLQGTYTRASCESKGLMSDLCIIFASTAYLRHREQQQQQKEKVNPAMPPTKQHSNDHVLQTHRRTGMADFLVRLERIKKLQVGLVPFLHAHVHFPKRLMYHTVAAAKLGRREEKRSKAVQSDNLATMARPQGGNTHPSTRELDTADLSCCTLA